MFQAEKVYNHMVLIQILSRQHLMKKAKFLIKAEKMWFESFMIRYKEEMQSR